LPFPAIFWPALIDFCPEAINHIWLKGHGHALFY
jgi:hypothetical protein